MKLSVFDISFLIGYAAICIGLYDSITFNTITNWFEAKKNIHTYNFKNAIAISEPLHIFRISLMIKDNNAYYSSCQYRFVKFKDYRVFIKDVHHEFINHVLSFIFHDKPRNKLFYTYRDVMLTVKKIF